MMSGGIWLGNRPIAMGPYSFNDTGFTGHTLPYPSIHAIGNLSVLSWVEEAAPSANVLNRLLCAVKTPVTLNSE
jgi:hypothetical protein